MEINGNYYRAAILWGSPCVAILFFYYVLCGFWNEYGSIGVKKLFGTNEYQYYTRRHVCFRLSHPKRDDEDEQPEEDSEDEVASERHRHDAQESCGSPDHDGRADLSQCAGYPVVLWGGRILVAMNREAIVSPW